MNDVGGERLTVDVLIGPDEGSTLARDVWQGLGARPYSLPPKHLYDERGARLFDAICDTPEYYVTRTEQALLEAIVDDLIARAHPTDLVELGSGAARKTRTLLESMLRYRGQARYVPLDVSEEMLRASAHTLLADYSDLEVHGLVADYEHHLGHLPNGGPRLIAFLGSTLGNLSDEEARRFLADVGRCLASGDRFLVGLDLVKSKPILDAAYNDAAGVTAQFNKNVLHVINSQLDADFDPDAFEHAAEYVPERKRVEIRLRSPEAQRVAVRGLGMEVDFDPGESILTELSHKFTREGAREMLESADLTLEQWYESPESYFALAMCKGRS